MLVLLDHLNMLRSAKGRPQEDQRCQNVRIIAVYQTDQIPGLPSAA